MTMRLIELENQSLFGIDAVAVSVTGREEISRPFEYYVTIDSPNENIRPEDVIGKPLGVRIDRGDEKPRYIHGYINHLLIDDAQYSLLDAGLPCRGYRVRLVPWLWYTTKAARCFVYLPELREKSIQQVLDEWLVRVRGYGHVEPHLEAKNAKVLQSRKTEHCIQYRESDFNFLARTLERYGIYYYFRHEANKHTLVLSDQPNYPTCDEENIAFPSSFGNQVNVDRVTSWQHDYDFVSGRWEQKDYDFKNPSTNLKVNASKHSRISLHGNIKYENYDYPNDYVNKPDGTNDSTNRLEEEEVKYSTVFASSTCKSLTAGYTFNLTSHPNDPGEANKSYLITTIEIAATQPGRIMGSGGDQRYNNRFMAVPKDAQYRPARLTHHPVLASIQTAVVTGPAKEEIHADEYGRIKVQFHWDRNGRYDENTSCWIRCQQSIAGNRWGSMVLPRIGQEVIVQFIEGDLDRPLVTGCVYNAEQMPAYDLPAEKTKTYLKTNSTLGGDGHNELMFDDKKDSEQVYIHAQHNMDVRVLNDSKERIFGHRHQVIGWEKDGQKGGDQCELVYESKHLHVMKDQAEHIEGNFVLMVGGGDASDGGNFDFVIDKQKCEKIGADSHLIVDGNFNQQISGGLSIQAGGDCQLKSGANIAMETGSAGEIHLKAGMKVIIESGMQLSLVGPGGFIDIGPAGVNIQGVMVNINSGGAAGSGSGCSPATAKEAKKAQPSKPELPINSRSGNKSTRR
jgi:type VI secretion system secreted protein VgrG